MSSILGSVSGNTSGDNDVYRASKAALNSLLRSFSARNRERSVVILHPGWVRTDMGGPNAAIGIEESVTGMVEVIASRAGKPGCVYLDYQGKRIDW
jgi:NAD(P)-dependent dehydrogenase (short-subunit alcohol dehydrogenase family)